MLMASDIQYQPSNAWSLITNPSKRTAMTITRADLNSDAVGISGDKKGWVLSGVENGGTRVAGAI